MKENFADALAFVLKWEGGYSDHKADRGGKTNCGITQATYDDWRICAGLGRNPVVGISGVEVEQIYRQKYWEAVRGDALPAPVDRVMLDSAVNVGPRQAIKWLQRAVGVSADGVLGKITLGALNLSDPVHVANAILDQRNDFYEFLVERDPAQAVFLAGWLNRTRNLQEVALA